MKLYGDQDFKLCVFDIETLACMFDAGFYNPDEDKWYEFEVSEERNDLSAFAKFYRRENWDYLVGYNGVSFDAQVIQYILNNWEKWHNKTGKEIVTLIYEFAQEIIDDQKYGLFIPYKESQMEVPIIDVFTILGLNNEARMTSLKKCEFQLDAPSVEEMPIHHSTIYLSPSEKEKVKNYRRTDVMETLRVLKLVLGETDHAVYKNNNQLELRVSIEEEFGIPCRNYSDIKIGDEIVKKYYAEAKGLQIRELPRKGTFRKEIHLKHCIPSYVKFKTPYFKELLKRTKETIIRPFEKKEKKKGKAKEKEFELEIKFNDREYILAKGGLHAKQSNEIWEAANGYRIKDHDVASYYPRIIINNGYFPKHLGKEMLQVYEQLYNKRVELKPLAKSDKKIKGVVEALKLSLNSVFGKMGNKDSWLYDAQTMYSVTLTGEFTLLMLIEMFEEAGIKVISANTDGVTTYAHESQEQVEKDILGKWQEMTDFEIETVEFKRFWYSTVNDYIAEKMDGSLKKKGDFITDFELWKNKSYRIVPLAIEAYFKDGKDSIDFIRNHKNIYDFCIMAKASGTTNIVEEWIEGEDIPVTATGELEELGWEERYGMWISPENLLKSADPYKAGVPFGEACQIAKTMYGVKRKAEHKKLVRYYLSKTGRQLYKRGMTTTGKTMDTLISAPTEIGEVNVQYFNQVTDPPYNVDYDQYILRTLKLIDKVSKTKRAKKFVASLQPSQQMELF